jgi:hypothetical protein
LVVVDLAVEHGMDGAAFVAYRLPSSRNVDDGQPAHGQADASLYVDTFVVGSSVAQATAHDS